MDNAIRNLISIAGCLFLFAAMLPSTAEAGNFHKNSLNFNNGIYSPGGFDAGYFMEVRYTRFFGNWRYFMEVSGGVSNLDIREDQSLMGVSGDLEKEQFFTYEFLLGYDAVPLRGFPFIIAGVAGVDQIDFVQFAYVLGFGKQVPMAVFTKRLSRLGLRYDIRNHIMNEPIKSKQNGSQEAVVTNNLIITLGLNLYF